MPASDPVRATPRRGRPSPTSPSGPARPRRAVRGVRARLARTWPLALAWLLAPAGCRGREDAAPVAPPVVSLVADAAPAGAPPDAPAVPAEPPPPFTLALTEPALLMELEAHGLSLGAVLGAGAARTAAELHAASARYRDLVAYAREDIAASIAEENRYRPDWGAVGPTMRARRRNLDPAWLVAASAGFELVGIVNRMDRAPFVPGSCGEVRLIYRLAYRAPKVASRLPLTLNVVYLLRPGTGSCRALASAWRLPPAPSAAWLRTAGPLRADLLSELKSIETNYQVIRSAAGIRNQHGGTAEYILRVFHERGGRLARAPLENTPDLARLTAQPALRRELLAFLEANLAAIDQGTVVIPARFLATQASSFAPHGLARMQNRPFDAIFDPADFAAFDLGGRRVIRTPAALLRRLDDLSCVGCHQGRTIAGFHFVGEDRDDIHPLNAVFFAGSGHFRTDLVRRRAYLEQLDRGEPPSLDRPLSFAPAAARAGYGDACSLPGARSFAWTCEPGLTCQLIDPAVGETELGHCFPDERRAGDPCLSHYVLQDHHSLDKMVMPWTELGCAPGYDCRMPVAGFPSGMCTGPCDLITTPGEICGPTAGAGFADCLSGRASFRTCLERHAELLGRGRCSPTRSCRNDYICARAGDEPDGACVPAYFLFQLRVDGHPPPR